MTTTRYQRLPGVLETVVDEDVILLSPDLRFMSLNTSAARIWELLAEPTSVAEIAAVLEAEFEVDAETAARAAAETVAVLGEKGSVGVVEA